MFGQEPRFPVDFLLGRVAEPLPGEVQDWVMENRARLRVAFDGARERLLAAAKRRKEKHDRQVWDAPLSVGQHVYLRDQGARGRHKIRDLWSSVVHQVVRAPTNDGAVYTVAPVADLGKTRNVHRDMLKAVIPLDAVGNTTPAPPSPSLVASADDSSDSETWFLVSEAITPPLAAHSHLSQPPMAPLVTTLEQADSLPPASYTSPSDQPSTSQQALRRTVRSTAGCHPNIHHLPRPAGPQGQASNRSQDPVSNSQTVIFIP